MSAIATRVKRWGALDSLWLCLAIFLHALLLLIPALKKNHEFTSNLPLNVTLLAPAPIEKPLAEEPESTRDEWPAIKNKAVAQPFTPELAIPEEPEVRADGEPPIKAEILTTARLLISASEMKWPLPSVNDSRQLGVFVPPPLPDNWRSGFRIADPILHPMVLTGKTEIVDRWLAADGSYHVVINTPTGQTLCGRALPWDPLQPLVEHVMQFRSCGGGKKRTFEMTQRIKRLTVIPSLANSTTN